MAFFTDGETAFLSLSLDPVGRRKAYLFRLTDRQARTAVYALPWLLIASIVAGIGTLIVAAFTAQLPSAEQAVPPLLAFGALAMLVAVAEFAFFGWVRATPASRVEEASRPRMTGLVLDRALSWKAYATFLFALITPFAGFFALSYADGAATGRAGFDTLDLVMLQLALVGLLFAGFSVMRLVRILRE